MNESRSCKKEDKVNQRCITGQMEGIYESKQLMLSVLQKRLSLELSVEYVNQ